VALFNKNLLAECEKMSAFLSAGDTANFSISIHAMKSMLSTIGAVGLSESAQKLETASKKKDYDCCAEHFPRFYEKLLSLHNQLSVIFPGREDNSAKEPGDAAYLASHIAKALAAANEFDSDAGIEAIDKLLAYDFGNEANSFLETAMAAFKNFDYDGAAASLEPMNLRRASSAVSKISP
jgi:hypothetical protein